MFLVIDEYDILFHVFCYFADDALLADAYRLAEQNLFSIFIYFIFREICRILIPVRLFSYLYLEICLSVFG